MAIGSDGQPIGGMRLVGAWIAAVVATLLLRILRFHQLLWLAGYMRGLARRPASADDAETVLRSIDVAARFVPARVACLERSLAAVLALAGRRRSVRWRIGVRTPPFAAHSWIEVDELAVGELVSVDSYTPILTV